MFNFKIDKQFNYKDELILKFANDSDKDLFHDIGYNKINKHLYMNLFNLLIKKLLDESELDFIDIRGINNYNQGNLITNKIITKLNLYSSSDIRYRSIITPARISSEIQDSSWFVSSFPWVNGPISSNNFGDIYLLGSLSANKEFEVYVCPLFKWTDNFIILLDEVDIRISEDFGNISDSLLNIKEYKVKYDINIKDSKVIYIYTDDYQENLDLLISKKRDDKIDYILDNESSGSKQDSQFRIYGKD